MPQYIGFSTINACKPRTTNISTGNDGGVGGIGGGLVSGAAGGRGTGGPLGAGGLAQLNFGKKFRITDEACVIQNFLNALNIQQGQKVGNPSYGTTMYSFVFEPNTSDVQFRLETEIRRVAQQDPRLTINAVSAFPQENGILVEIEMAVNPFNQARLLSLFVSQATNQTIIQ